MTTNNSRISDDGMSLFCYGLKELALCGGRNL